MTRLVGVGSIPDHGADARQAARDGVTFRNVNQALTRSAQCELRPVRVPGLLSPDSQPRPVDGSGRGFSLGGLPCRAANHNRAARSWRAVCCTVEQTPLPGNGVMASRVWRTTLDARSPEAQGDYLDKRRPLRGNEPAPPAET
jgi:hypothetical protein